MNNSKQIKIGAILSYISIAVNIAVGLLYTPWMVEHIGQSQYGLYTLSTSLITLFLVDFGLSSATARYLSKYNAEGDQEKAATFLGAVYKLYLIVDTIIFVALIVVFFCLDSIYVNLTPGELEQFKVVYVISALFSVINFPFVTFNGILTAYEKFMPLKLADMFYRIFNVALTVVALLMGYGLYALVTVHAAVGLFVVFFKFLVIKKTIPIKVKFKNTDKRIYKEIFGFSIWVTVEALAQRLVFNITPSILGIVSSSVAIAVFGVVATIEGHTYTITTAISGLFMPKVARIINEKDTQENLNPLFLSVGKFQYAINGLIIAGFAVVGHTFINLWMGPEYIYAYYGILLVMIPGIFFNSLQIANTTMVVTKKVNLQAYVSIFTGIVNICLSFPLSKFFGVIGASISICIAYTLRTIVLLIIYQRELPLDIPMFIKKCYGKMSIPVIITIVVGIGINHLIADGGWTRFIIKAVILTVVYFVSVYFIGLDKNEQKKIVSIFKRFKKSQGD